jgi:hypothetical protein
MHCFDMEADPAIGKGWRKVQRVDLVDEKPIQYLFIIFIN